MLVVGNNSTRCAIFKWYPGTCFHINIKDFGDLKYFLGIEVTPLHSSLFLSQWNYTLNILTECGMLGLYPSSFPMKQHHKLFDDSGPLFGNVGKYRRLVGRQIYLTITILEFSYSVHMLLQFIRQPYEGHSNVALRILRYLKRWPTQGISLKPSSLQFDWATYPFDSAVY